MINQNNENLRIKGFVWELKILDENGVVIDSEKKHNLIPNEGLDFLIEAPFGLSAPIHNFYLGLYRGNYMPNQNTKASDIPSNMIEMTDYSELARPLWDKTKQSGPSIDNLSNKAEFTITQDRTIYGAFLVSSDVKGGSGGVVLSCVRFSSPKNVTSGQTLNLSGGIMYTSAG